MPNEAEKRSAEINAAADALLFPGGGGVAIWVRRDELLPRAAIRFNRHGPEKDKPVDVVEVASMLAALKVAVSRATDALADTMDMPRATLYGMVEEAHKVLAPKFSADTVIRRRS